MQKKIHFFKILKCTSTLKKVSHKRARRIIHVEYPQAVLRTFVSTLYLPQRRPLIRAFLLARVRSIFRLPNIILYYCYLVQTRPVDDRIHIFMTLPEIYSWHPRKYTDTREKLNCMLLHSCMHSKCISGFVSSNRRVRTIATTTTTINDLRTHRRRHRPLPLRQVTWLHLRSSWA